MVDTTRETAPTQKLTAVLRAADTWAESLIDRSGRNELLFCKDRGKLILDGAPTAALQRLLRGRTVRLRELFPDDADHMVAAKTTESIRRRIKEYHEERGIRVGRIVYAFASWTDTKDRVVRAPVLLRDVRVAKTALGFGDHELMADPDLEVSPVLLSYLDSTFRVAMDRSTISELNDFVDEPDQVEAALDQLRKTFAAIPGFRIEPGVLMGIFHYANLAMYQDLKDNSETYANNLLFAAIAGDVDARASIRRPVGEIERDLPDTIPPQDEYLVLDADPSQSYVINAAVAGRNLVVQGPPGTGKSQTISNIISTLIARGKTVLFVAEKRAAIDAVLTRLTQTGLRSAILDLHFTTANRATAYQQFREAIDASGRALPVNTADSDALLVRTRDTMIRHADAMHTPVPPWGVSVFDVQANLIGAEATVRTPARISTLHMRQLYGAAAARARETLGRLLDLDALVPESERGPWGAAALDSMEAATRAREVVRGMQTNLAHLRAVCDELSSSAGLTPPASPDQCVALVRLCSRTNAVTSAWSQEIWDEDLDRLMVATGDRSYRRSSTLKVGFWERRRLRKRTRGLRVTAATLLHNEVRDAAALVAEWHSLAGVARPPSGLAAEAAAPALSATWPLMNDFTRIFGPAQSARTWPDLTSVLDSLNADSLGAARAAETRMLLAELHRLGLDELTTWVSRSAQTWPDVDRRRLGLAALDYSWNASVLDEARIANPALATFNGRNHSSVAAEFSSADRQHIGGNAARVSRLVAERLTAVRSTHPEQEMFLDKELPRKRKLKSIRELMESAPDVLLAAKPCWAMSPLLVSQMLPPGELFDVVVFDEASQVQPANAMPSLARAKTAIVAGDTRQLPPTTFFEEQLEGSDSDEDTEEALTSDVESILEAFNRALGQSLANEFYLGWHYRSEDARLIAFSNEAFYDNRLTTFPGTAVNSPLRLVIVDNPAPVDAASDATSGTSDAAVGAEVERVVTLALEHARVRPHESLGIIALSLRHANRIEAALYRRLQDHPELRPFFDEDREDACFIKNLERVQGDERDAIILSAGFGKVNGRLLRRFGPINLAGGERRLNVAITRARKRMDVVTSFAPEDLDPDSLTSDGAVALAKFVRFAAAGGHELGAEYRDAPVLNPFEIAVRDRLIGAGVDVMCQWGIAGYYIDFVAKHPDIPGRLVLAIEADGASYHSAETARARDRLRQEHLERLGWRFHRIWSTDWFNDPDAETAKVVKAYATALEASQQTGPEPTAAAQPAPVEQTDAEPPSRALPRPDLPSAIPIANYTEAQLRALVAWIKSDGLLRTDEELIRTACTELGYGRLGKQIRERLTSVVRSP